MPHRCSEYCNKLHSVMVKQGCAGDESVAEPRRRVNPLKGFKIMVRLLSMLFMLTLLLTACGGAPAAPAPAPTDVPITEATSAPLAAVEAPLACPTGFSFFVHSAGESCVPTNPQRIVTIQDQNALLPLLELGVKPVGSAGQPLEDGGFRFRRVADFDTTGIEFVGNYWGEANAETITLLQPDLIVGDAFGVDYYDLHSQIAPTVLIDVHGRPLDEALIDFAALVGRSDEAARLRTAYEERIAALLDALGERKDRLSISVITAGDAGEFYRADTGQALGTVTSDLDLLRPAPQQGEGGFVDAFSLETLPQHDADVVLVINFGGEDQDPNFTAFVNSPLFTTLAAARAEQTYIIDGTRTVGAGWSKMDAFLSELERILLAPELDVDIVTE
jgi:iron complex transport system substrate-binding protein